MIVHTDLSCLIVCIFHMQPQYLSNGFCQLTIIPHARCRCVNMITRDIKVMTLQTYGFLEASFLILVAKSHIDQALLLVMCHKAIRATVANE